MRALVAFLILLMTASAAQAAPPKWTVDKAASSVGFRASLDSIGFDGRFERWEADIAFDPADLPGSKVTASFDMASARAGDAARDEALPSSDWFDVKRFPKATFTTRTIRADGPGRYVAAGDLTIRGVSRPVELPFTLAITGDTAKMQGSVVLDRSAFGVGQGQWATGEMVSTEVKVTIALTARRMR